MDKLTKAFLAEKTRDRLEEALTATTEPCTVATIQHILSSSPQEKSSILKLTNGNGDTALHFALNHSLRQSQQANECDADNRVLSLSVIQHLIHLHPAALVARNRDGYTPLDLAIQSSTRNTSSGRLKNSTKNLLDDVARLLDESMVKAMKYTRNHHRHGTDYFRLLICRKTGCVRTDILSHFMQSYPHLLKSGDTKSGNTLLHFLCQQNNVSVESIQMVHQTYPKALERTNQQKETPLSLACQGPLISNVPVMEYLIQQATAASKKGRSLLSKSDARENTPLHHACRNQSVLTHGNLNHAFNVIQMLVTAAPNVLDKRNFDRETPLHCACQSLLAAHLPSSYASLTKRIIWYLVEAHPNTALSKTNGYYETPLHICCKYATAVDLDLLQFLVDRFPAACLLSYFYHNLPVYRLAQSLPEVRIGEAEAISDSHEREHFYSDKDQAKLEFMNQATQAAAMAMQEAMILCRMPDKTSSMDSLLTELQTLYLSAAVAAPAVAAIATTLNAAEEPAGWNMGVWIWINRGRHSSLIASLYRMNQAGRRYFHTDARNVQQGIKVLNAGRHNLTCLFLHVRENPVLCVRMASQAAK